MPQDELSNHGAPTIVAIVASVWLQHALIVLLHAIPELKLTACTATVRVLLSLDLEQIPDLVVLDAYEQDERASDQLRRLKAAWPATRYIVLVEHNRQKALMRAIGADEVLLKGVSPGQLMGVIQKMRGAHRDRPAQPQCPTQVAGTYRATLPESGTGQGVTLVLSTNGTVELSNPPDQTPQTTEVGWWQTNKDGTITVTLTGLQDGQGYDTPKVIIFEPLPDELIVVKPAQNLPGGKWLKEPS